MVLILLKFYFRKKKKKPTTGKYKNIFLKGKSFSDGFVLQWLNKGLWWYRISTLLYDYPDRMIPSTWICPLVIRTKVSNIWLWWEILSASYLLCVWSCLCYIRDGISSISQNWKNYKCSCVLVMLFRFLHSRRYPSQFWLIEPTSSFVLHLF